MGALIDMIDERYGRLTIVKRAGSTKSGKATWVCRCECGSEIIVSGDSLRSGKTKSCGCLSRDNSGARNLVNITGKKFGLLYVKERNGSTKRGKATWKCVCDCGTEVIVSGDDLRSGKTKSCGCQRYLGHPKHGLSKTRLYNIWGHIKTRCTNPNSDGYKWYGGRGIAICDDWLEFDNFYKWAIDNGYDDSLSIDRIDPNKNYEPSNCRWASMEVQANNRRSNVSVTIEGVSHTIAEWSKITGIPYGVIYNKFRTGSTINV